jgi:NhaP-type Na+/H+ or K+/H+ antiporter
VHSLAFVLIAFAFIVYGAVSAVLERSVVSAPMVFLGLGVLLSDQVLGLADASAIGRAGETLVEVTLALVLFTDAVRIDLRSLRAEYAVPVRLLTIGLPLTLVLGFGAGFLPGLGLGWQEAGLLAAMLAATDAALGRAVVTDRRLPPRIAQGLNVESGLNDGISVPFVLVFLGLAAATPAEQQLGLAHVMAQQIGMGAIGGVAAGLVGGTALAYADRRGWVDGAWRQIATLATALLAFSVASQLGGSGFIGAYAGGIAFGLAHGAASARVTHLADQGAEVLSAGVFVFFGIVAPAILRESVSGAVILYALISLTIVRMLPVVVSMIGMKMRRPTLLFLGWFGPRGLASIAFAFLVLAEDVPHGKTIVAVVFWTVLLSVVLHGVSAVPLTGRYAAWYVGHPRRGELSEAVPAAEQRARRPVMRAK